MDFSKKNDFIVKQKNAKFFDQDLKLFREHCPNSRLHAELKRANSFNKHILDGHMLFELLDKVSIEDVLKNRGIETVAEPGNKPDKSKKKPAESGKALTPAPAAAPAVPPDSTNVAADPAPPEPAPVPTITAADPAPPDPAPDSTTVADPAPAPPVDQTLQELEKQANELAAKKSEIEGKEEELKDKEAALEDKEADLEDKEAALDDKESELNDKEAALEKQAEELKAAPKAVSKKKPSTKSSPG